MKTTRIQLTPTPYHVDVFVSKNIRAVEESMCELYDEKPGSLQLNMQKDDQGMVGEVGKNIVMVITDFSETLISHEATHVTWMLAKKIGMTWDEESQELQAYYIDHIVSEVLKMKE